MPVIESVRENGTRRVQWECEGESLTEQAPAGEHDINAIMNRALRTGMVPTTTRVMMHGDFTSISSYHEALEKIRQADDAFMRLPAEVRSEFDNDAGLMIAFLDDPNNHERARELGLLPRKRDVPTTEAPDPVLPLESPTEGDIEPSAGSK